MGVREMVSSGARFICHRRPHETMTLEDQVDVWDSRAVVITIAGGCQGATLSVGMCL